MLRFATELWDQGFSQTEIAAAFKIAVVDLPRTLGKSLTRLLAYDIEWVFAGHGGSYHLPTDEMRARLAA